MTASPSSVRTLKEYSKHVPASEELKDAFVRLSGETNDRALVVTATALLESSLARLIAGKFRRNTEEVWKEIFDRNGPLSSFSYKIQIGYALALFGPDTRADLDHIREIRNAFAHSVRPLSFQEEAVINVCKRLKHLSHFFEGLDDPNVMGPLPTSAKVIFQVTSMYLAFAFDDSIALEDEEFDIITSVLDF